MIPDKFTPKVWTTLHEGYDLSKFKADIIAGLTVAIVALPLSMALAIASGASPDKGLITAIIAGFMISLLGGSRVQIGGPTGAFIVVVFSVIAQHGYDGLLLATLTAGAILVIAGYAQFGKVIKFIPYPVVTGFTTGIALIIAFSQIKDFFGFQIEKLPAEFIPKLMSYSEHIDTINLTSLYIGSAALIIIILLKRYAPKLPGYLIAIASMAIITYGMHLNVDTIGSRFPNMPSNVPMPSMPVWNWSLFVEIIPSAFTIAFLAGIESLLSAVVADGMTGYKHRSNQELVGQGFANIASAFFGGMPATGAIARTATNIKAGGNTPIAGIVHALFILLFMLFATNLMTFVPLAALSAILFVVAWNMSEVKHFIHIFKLSKRDLLVMILTFTLTIFVDLSVAIGVGVTLSSLLFMHEMSKGTSFHYQGRKLRDLDADEIQEDVKQREDLPEGVEVFRFTGPIFFGMSGMMLETLQSIGDIPKVLIIRMKLVPYIDSAGLNALTEAIEVTNNQGSIVIMAGIQEQPAKILKKAKVEEDKKMLFFTKNYDQAINLANQLTSSD